MTALAVIIVGAPRSGTYWLVDLLNSRFGIQLPSETHFIPLFHKYLWLWGDLSRRSNRTRLLRNIYEFLQIWTPRSSHSSEYVEQIRQLSLLVTLDKGHAEQILDESNDYPSLIEALFRHFAQLHGGDVSGDKSAHYQVLDPEQVFHLFPKAVMLHVIRDGRDVAMSWTKQWFGPSSIAEAAAKWRDHIEVNRIWGHRNLARYHEIHYEKLATDLEGEIRRLEIFMNRTAHVATADDSKSALARALSNTGSHAGMLDIVAQDNIARWKQEMSAADLACFEQIAGTALADCGYDVSTKNKPASSRGLPRFSRHTIRVMAKTILPLALGVCTRLGFSPLALLNRQFPQQWRSVRLLQNEK